MSKRSAPFSATNEPSSKRTSSSSSSSSTSLNSFFPTTHTPRPPSPLVHSDPLTDRSSTFIAHAAPCTSASSASTFQSYIRSLRSPSHPVECSHEMVGWRVMAPKVGKSGLESEEDWTVRDGGEDDGEKDGGSTIREVLRREGAVDVMVVVSRLYGGQMLGPARFAHIRTVTSQALSRLSLAQALPTLLAQLSSLDAEIASLSSNPKPLTEAEKEKVRVQYAGLDVQKAERLVAAREKRVELLRRQKAKREEEERKEMEELQRRAEEEAIAAVEAEQAAGGEGGEGGDGGADEEEEDEAAAYDLWMREREEAKRRKKEAQAKETEKPEGEKEV